jgi:hypothetical protein
VPAISLRRRTVPAIGEMRDLVWVCTTTERPDDDVSTIKERPGVFRCNARIRNLRADQILDYQAVFGSQDKPPTIEITIRYPPDVKVDLNHWVYRESSDAQTWYKVRNVWDVGNVQRFLFLDCSIDTVNDIRTDVATQQRAPVWETPSMD